MNFYLKLPDVTCPTNGDDLDDRAFIQQIDNLVATFHAYFRLGNRFARWEFQQLRIHCLMLTFVTTQPQTHDSLLELNKEIQDVLNCNRGELPPFFARDAPTQIQSSDGIVIHSPGMYFMGCLP